MRVVISFLVGALVGAAGYWYLGQPQNQVATSPPRTENTAPATGTQTESHPTWSKTSATIKDELERTGKVIREKSEQAGAAIADATANTRISTSIKAKLVRDSGLAGFKIGVSTTDGVVTLSGAVHSYEDIDKAMNIALNTDGVHKVISTLQVKPNGPIEQERERKAQS